MRVVFLARYIVNKIDVAESSVRHRPRTESEPQRTERHFLHKSSRTVNGTMPRTSELVHDLHTCAETSTTRNNSTLDSSMRCLDRSHHSGHNLYK